MEKRTDFSILHNGVFQETNLHCCLLDGNKIYSPEICQNVAMIWQEKNSSQLFNGDVYSLIQSKLQDGQIYYWLQKTEYKYFYGTNLQNSNSLERSDILAVCSVIETSDHFILLGKRSASLAESTSQWHVIGGNIDFLPSDKDASFTAIQNEMQEEAGILPDDIYQLVCLGLGRNEKIHKPEFLFYTNLKITKTELENKLNYAQDKHEHSQFILLPVSDLTHFLASHSFANIGKAAVHQFLRYKDKI
jgi:8-oxo-dGTP pyrophosphatase MutT (NUDIX family)